MTPRPEPMEPLAKPSGITLSVHQQHVLAEAERLLGLRPDEGPGLPFLAEKYAELVEGGDLAARVRRAAWFHDEGKTYDLWQNACRADYEKYRAWRQKQGLDPDAVDAADWDRFYRSCRKRGESTGPSLMKAGVRHEIASLHLCKHKGLDLAERVAIGAHHGKLGTRHVRRWKEDGGGTFAVLWDEFEKESYNGYRVFQRNRGSDTPLLRRYELAGVRALLRLADTRASRAESGGELAPIKSFRYSYPHEKPSAVQQLALDHAEDWVTILRAPTGSGKTDAAFLWAERQIDLGRADRLVVAMPTRFTSNALALGNAEALGQTGLYHSSAWYARYSDRQRGTPGYDMAKEEHKLARLLATPITVCTIDHLLIALTGSREDHHATFFFLANSAVVFDEVDFYDPFVQANLVVLLRALRTLRVPVLLMSATVPKSARALYSVETDIREAKENTSGRRIVRRHDPIGKPEDAADVLGRMIEEGTGIVYANTVERAYRTYRWLHSGENNPDGVPVYLYHSRFTEPDKKVIETALVGDEELDVPGALGRRAWKAGRARGIAVLTQIGEMSINISAPLMLTDLCPWDRLAQRMGRLARFRKQIPEGELFVADPHRDGALYPAPYGSFEPRKGWTAGEALVDTKERLDERLSGADGTELTPADLVDEVNRLYPTAPEPDIDASTNAGRLEELIRRNWMIVQASEASEEEGGILGGWRSRDIPAQETVIVHQPDDTPVDKPYRFNTYEDARGFMLEHSVECPTYLVERGVKRGVMSQFSYVVGNEKYEDAEYVWLCTEYDEPVEGQGGGLGALSVRDHEDRPPVADEDDW